MENDTSTQHTRHFDDLNFTVIADVHSHRVDFKVYDITGRSQNEETGVFNVRLWAKEHEGHFESVDQIEMADVYLHGGVKWDWCSNWHFDEQDRVMLHGCDRAGIQRFGDIMGKCWDMAAELCPSWDSN